MQSEGRHGRWVRLGVMMGVRGQNSRGRVGKGGGSGAEVGEGSTTSRRGRIVR